MCQVVSQLSAFILAVPSSLEHFSLRFSCDWFIVDVTSSEALSGPHLKLATTTLKGTLSHYLVLFPLKHSPLSEIIFFMTVHSLSP